MMRFHCCCHISEWLTRIESVECKELAFSFYYVCLSFSQSVTFDALSETFTGRAEKVGLVLSKFIDSLHKGHERD